MSTFDEMCFLSSALAGKGNLTVTAELGSISAHPIPHDKLAVSIFLHLIFIHRLTEEQKAVICRLLLFSSLVLINLALSGPT